MSRVMIIPWIPSVTMRVKGMVEEPLIEYTNDFGRHLGYRLRKSEDAMGT
jgi:hypothetical protein